MKAVLYLVCGYEKMEHKEELEKKIHSFLFLYSTGQHWYQYSSGWKIVLNSKIDLDILCAWKENLENNYSLISFTVEFEE